MIYSLTCVLILKAFRILLLLLKHLYYSFVFVGFVCMCLVLSNAVLDGTLAGLSFFFLLTFFCNAMLSVYLVSRKLIKCSVRSSAVFLLYSVSIWPVEHRLAKELYTISFHFIVWTTFFGGKMWLIFMRHKHQHMF